MADRRATRIATARAIVRRASRAAGRAGIEVTRDNEFARAVLDLDDGENNGFVPVRRVQ